MINLFLDDNRNPKDAYMETGDKIYMNLAWEVVRSYEDFCSYLEKMHIETLILPEIISFDHNLAPEHYQMSFGDIPYEQFKYKTGLHCALWLKEFCHTNDLLIPKVLSHSASPQGRKNILDVFRAS